MMKKKNNIRNQKLSYILVILVIILDLSFQKDKKSEEQLNFLDDFDIIKFGAKDLFKLYNNNDRTTFVNDISIWGPKMSSQQLKDGYRFFGPMISEYTWQKPKFDCIIVKPKKGKEKMMSEPIGHTRIWENYATYKLIIMKPLCQPGHRATSSVVRVSYWTGTHKKKWGQGLCVDEKYFVMGREYKVWEDQGSGNKRDCGLWSFYQNHSTMQAYNKYFLDMVSSDYVIPIYDNQKEIY